MNGWATAGKLFDEKNTLKKAEGNKSQAARLIGLTRRTLYSRMEKHGLRRPDDGESVESDEAGETVGGGA